MRAPAALAAGLAALTLGLTACGASKPEALPDDATFRSCLSDAGVAPEDLDTFAARQAAFKATAAWNCVLALSSAEDRHAVLQGVYPADAPALLAALTGWIDTQKDDGTAIAENVGTLLAAADDPMPSDSSKASSRSQADDILQEKLAIAIYEHTDGELAGYTAYLARPDLEGDPDAPARYYNDVMDKGGAIADRLRGYASTMDATRDRLRAT